MKQISNEHPNIKINVVNYNKVLALINSEKGKWNPFSQPVRCLMQGVLNEDKYWINSNSNSDDLFKNF